MLRRAALRSISLRALVVLFALSITLTLRTTPLRADQPQECEPRKTLLQWSYGTSFSGGPELDKPLITDRPDFTESPETVGLGVLQIEGGYTYTFDDNATSQTVSNSAPEALFRYGIFADWLELRIGQNFGSEDDGFVQNTGAEDLYLGLKICLTPQEHWLPAMGLIPQMTVPSGSPGLTAGKVLPGVNWVYSWEINDFISLGGETEFDLEVDDVTNRTYTQWAESWTVEYKLTEKLGAFTEWYCLLPAGADTAKPQQYIDIGFTYLITDNVQWDVRGGLGLNDAADNYFVGSGLSVRIK